MKKTVDFFDKLEDRIRGVLSHYPLTYATVAGIGVVLFWRGVWESADRIGIPPFWSLVIGWLTLLSTGIMVAHFLGAKIIISGLKGDKKLEEKTLQEIENEEGSLKKIKEKIDRIESMVKEIKER